MYKKKWKIYDDGCTTLGIGSESIVTRDAWRQTSLLLNPDSLSTVYNMFFIFKSPVVEVTLNAIASYWSNPGIVTTSSGSQSQGWPQAQIRSQALMASAININALIVIQIFQLGSSPGRGTTVNLKHSILRYHNPRAPRPLQTQESRLM